MARCLALLAGAAALVAAQPPASCPGTPNTQPITPAAMTLVAANANGLK
jgi:hypothetical protein